MDRRWKILLWASMGLIGSAACRASLPARTPDVAALVQRGQLKLGKSDQERVIRLLGVPARQEKKWLHGKIRGGPDITHRWVTLHYPQLGIECEVTQLQHRTRLDEITLKPPYAKPVLDSIYLGRQRLGTLARGLRQPVRSQLEDRYLEPYEVQGSVAVGDIRLQAHIQLDSAIWNRCQRRRSLLDSLLSATPIDRIVFTND